jgi:hypothetical protein
MDQQLASSTSGGGGNGRSFGTSVPAGSMTRSWLEINPFKVTVYTTTATIISYMDSKSSNESENSQIAQIIQAQAWRKVLMVQ